MSRHSRKITHLLRDECGSTSIEYGLLALLVSISAVIGIAAFGGALDEALYYITEKISGALS